MTQANRSEKQAGAIVGSTTTCTRPTTGTCCAGTARVVLHDLRQGSPTDGATLTLDLDGDHDRGLFIPPGVAHGFASLTDLTLWYLVDGYYNPERRARSGLGRPGHRRPTGASPTRCCRPATGPTRCASEIPAGVQPRLRPADLSGARRRV